MGKLKKADHSKSSPILVTDELVDGLDALRRSTIKLRNAGALHPNALVLNDSALLGVDWSARSEISEAEFICALEAYGPSEIEEVFDQLHPDYSANKDENYWNDYTDLATAQEGANDLGQLLGRLRSHLDRTTVILNELSGRDVVLQAFCRNIEHNEIQRLLLRQRKEGSRLIKMYRVSYGTLLRKISAAEGVLYQHDVPGLLYRRTTEEIVIGPDGEIESDTQAEPKDWRAILGARDPVTIRLRQTRARYFQTVILRCKEKRIKLET
ncbi:MAG: hypothetical protein IH853_06455, partial [Bacteroidetes bacterium]|nr:hypothetical protein [Bacteroidota bacterium]